MAEGKKSFIAYSDWYDIFKEMPNEKAGILIKHIFSYVNDEEPELEDWALKSVFAQIKNTLKRDLNKWENQRNQRVEAGKKSAEVRKQKSTTVEQPLKLVDEKTRKLTVSDSDSVSDSVINNIISFLNEKTGKDFKSSSKATQTKINARLKEGFTEIDFRKVIELKTKEWLNKPDMIQYLRPETLFGTKFESYLNSDKNHRLQTTNKVNLGKNNQSYDDLFKKDWDGR